MLHFVLISLVTVTKVVESSSVSLRSRELYKRTVLWGLPVHVMYNADVCGSDLFWLLYTAPQAIQVYDCFASQRRCKASQAYWWMCLTDYTVFLDTWGRSLFFGLEHSLWSWIIFDCKHRSQYRKSILKPSFPAHPAAKKSPEEMRKNPNFRKA